MEQYSGQEEVGPNTSNLHHTAAVTTGLIYFGPGYVPLYSRPIRNPCGCLILLLFEVILYYKYMVIPYLNAFKKS